MGYDPQPCAGGRSAEQIFEKTGEVERVCPPRDEGGSLAQAFFTGETDKVGPDRSEGGRVGCSLRPAVSLLEGNRLSVAFPP